MMATIPLKPHACTWPCPDEGRAWRPRAPRPRHARGRTATSGRRPRRASAWPRCTTTLPPRTRHSPTSAASRAASSPTHHAWREEAARVQVHDRAPEPCDEGKGAPHGGASASPRSCTSTTTRSISSPYTRRSCVASDVRVRITGDTWARVSPHARHGASAGQAPSPHASARAALASGW